MCGISGFINHQGKEISEGNIYKMLNSQIHRGPDASGVYYNKYVAFAHNRLSLLDLSSNGNQPFEDEEHILVFNGEIYNFRELRNELPEIKYKSSSDTAVLFHALKLWGIVKTLAKIEGMFAFSWYNKKSKELILSRDRLGIKPLFYATDSNGTFWFASEMKAILAVNSFKPNAIKMLYSSLGVLEKSRYETAWDDIFHVKPGTFIAINQNGIIERQYYNLMKTVNEREYLRLDKMKMNDVLYEFENLFSSAVDKMLVSDAPMGAYVSGGIDSSLIAYYASKTNKDLKLFTANIKGKYSEFDDATLLAKSLNLQLYDYPFEKEMGLRDWAKVCWHYESPIITHFNAIPFSNVSALAREHNVKAVLTGEGADELFLGYPKLLTKRYDKLLNSPFNLLNSLYKKIPKLYEHVSNTGGSQDLLSIFELASQNYTRQILRDDGINQYRFLSDKEQKEQYLTAQMLQEGIVSLLWRNDRMGMIHSIESRFPFLDEKILAFAMNLPIKFKIGRTHKFYNYKHPFLIDKLIVRNLAVNKIPNKLIYKKKNGFPTYALRHTYVRPQFFADGVLKDILNMSNKQVEYMIYNINNYNGALLASFEIWAKLFVANESIEEVSEKINNDFVIL